jgi:hypothetical protein
MAVPNIDKRLLGIWRSDRERTIAQWVFPRRLAQRRREQFAALFGKLVLRFTPAFAYTEFEGQLTRCRYGLLWSGPDSCVVLYQHPHGESVQHIHFDGTHLYVLGGASIEFFRRVTPNQPFNQSAKRRRRSVPVVRRTPAPG